jgi:hypothetical protein
MPRLCLFLLAALGVVGCQNRIPDDALALQPDTLERRLLESRRFAGGKEIEILSACSGVVQDMGFTIDESATPLGVMVASKNREAGDTGGRVAMAILFGANAANSMDRSQKIRICIVIKPVVGKEGKEWVVRATFQRAVWNSYGQLTRLEGLREPELYQQFFEKLSKSVFLEAQKI